MSLEGPCPLHHGHTPDATEESPVTDLDDTTFAAGINGAWTVDRYEADRIVGDLPRRNLDRMLARASSPSESAARAGRFSPDGSR